MFNLMMPCMSLIAFIALMFIASYAGFFVLVATVMGSRNRYTSTLLLGAIMVVFELVVNRLPSLLH